MPATKYTVSGTVRDEGGKPVEQASVTVYRPFSKTGPSFTSQTDATGFYRGELPAGSYEGWVRKPGFEPVVQKGVAVPRDTSLDFTIRPGVLVHGKVSEFNVGGLVGATVEVVSGPDTGRSTTTGFAVPGSYSFGYVRPGDFTVRARKAGYDTVDKPIHANVDSIVDFTLKWSYGSCLNSVTPVLFDRLPSAGATGRVIVGANPARIWTATPNASWIEILSPASRKGSGELDFRMAPHPLGATQMRNSSIMIRCSDSEGQNIWISQLPDCQVHLEPTPTSPTVFGRAGGQGELKVRTGTPYCDWEARSQSDWIYTVGISSWRGDPPVNLSFVVRPNTTGSDRIGRLVVGETVWQVRQLGE